jgi:hypothetical protein
MPKNAKAEARREAGLYRGEDLQTCVGLRPLFRPPQRHRLLDRLPEKNGGLGQRQ